MIKDSYVIDFGSKSIDFLGIIIDKAILINKLQTIICYLLMMVKNAACLGVMSTNKNDWIH